MDLWTALFTVFRRWYVSLPIAVLGVVATIMIGGRIEQQYEASASVVLVPAPYKLINGISQPPENPYDPRGASAAVFRRVSSPDLQREFEADGDSKDFTVSLDQNAAIIDFSVTGAGAEEALQTAERLVQETKTNLARIQAAALVEEDAAISMNLINISAEAEPVKGNKPRVMATIFVLGMVAAISAAFIVESFGNRRRQRAAGLGGMAMPPLQPMPGYAYQPMAGQVPPAGYLPVAPVAMVAPAEVPTPTAPAGSPSQAPDDLYGSVDDLADDLDAADDAPADPAASDSRTEARPRGGNGVIGRNGKTIGTTESSERKSIDSGRRRGPKSSERTTVPATSTPTNGRPSGPEGNGGAKPGDVDAAADALIDLTAAPVELDAEQASVPTAATGRRQRTTGGVDTIEAVTAAPAAAAPTAATSATTQPQPATDRSSVDASTDAGSDAGARVERSEQHTAAKADATPADDGAEQHPVSAKEPVAKRANGNGSARNPAASGRTVAKPGGRPAADDGGRTPSTPAPTTVDGGTSSNARMRDGAKGRRASLFSASGDRKKDETPPAE